MNKRERGEGGGLREWGGGAGCPYIELYTLAPPLHGIVSPDHLQSSVRIQSMSGRSGGIQFYIRV